MFRWYRRATAEQQDSLTREFKTLLVRTYSSALTNYRDHAIEFKRHRAPAVFVGRADVDQFDEQGFSHLNVHGDLLAGFQAVKKRGRGQDRHLGPCQ